MEMLMPLQRYVHQLRPRKESYVNHIDKIQILFNESSGLTTDNASITELFPALAFNNNFRPSNVEDFKKFLYKLGDMKRNQKKTFVNDSNRQAGLALVNKLPSMEDRFVKSKTENAIGITNYLYDLHSSKPIKNIIWGYREKPRGVPKNHAGDIFVFFRNGEILGISLKAGTKKSKEPLLNTYVATQFTKLNKTKELKFLEDALWDGVYSKIPDIDVIATKNNYMDGDRKRTADIRQKYLDFFIDNETEANNLYVIMVKIQREHFCKMLNKLSIEDFKNWIFNNFNLQKPQTVPLVLVKAVGVTAEQKGDDLASLLPLVTRFHAYLNTSSVQGWFIDIDTPDEMKRLELTIRSDAGVRAGKSLAKLGRLAKFTRLKMQYNGIFDR